MTQTSTYDRVMHLVGLVSLGLLGLSASPEIYKHFPWWLIAAASLAAFVVQASTMPIAARPDSIIKAAKSAGGSLLPMLIFLAPTAILVPCLFLTGCPPAATPGVSPTPVQAFDACSSKVAENKALDILGLVARATVGNDWRGALATLVTTYGLDEVRCAAQLFSNTMTRKAAMDATAALQRERALMWLAQTADGGV